MPAPANPRDLPPSAILALSQGKKIDAIRIVRQECGVDLKTAKDTVDAFLRTRPDLAPTVTDWSASARRGYIMWLIVLVLICLATVYYLRGR